jgi:DNA repair exonuclease SbcCD nuclease subunit
MRFAHCADIHLDSPLRGLERYEGAPVEKIRNAPRQAFTSLVDTCIREKVDFLLIAGDLYDGDWKDFGTGLYFIAEMRRLREAEIPVFLLFGNHDAISQITRNLSHLPDNVRIFSSAEAETLPIDDLGVAVHGQSFVKRDVTTNLAASYPAPIPGLFNIGLLHTALTGRDGHEKYAPCTVEQLAAHGYDYWALGHVHAREIVHEQPWIVFPGNLQGRHVNEPGEKGFSIVTVENGEVASVEHHPVDVLRWCRVEVDAAGATTQVVLLDKVQEEIIKAIDQTEGRFLAARVRVRGRCEIHPSLVADPEAWRSEIRAAALAAAGDNVWIEAIETETDPVVELASIGDLDDAFGELLRGLDALLGDAERSKDIIEKTARDVIGTLPAEIRNDPLLHEGLAADRVRHDVGHLLLHRLTQKPS